ncbi:MAG: hypothetical protein WBR28_08835 [Mycobacterium sp.]
MKRAGLQVNRVKLLTLPRKCAATAADTSSAPAATGPWSNQRPPDAPRSAPNQIGCRRPQ